MINIRHTVFFYCTSFIDMGDSLFQCDAFNLIAPLSLKYEFGIFFYNAGLRLQNFS